MKEATELRKSLPARGGKDIVEIGETAKATLGAIVEKAFPDVVSVVKEGKEWRVMVEVLERRAVPDTQDIIGRYEVRLDEKRDVLGYKRVVQRRRMDLDKEEEWE